MSGWCVPTPGEALENVCTRICVCWTRGYRQCGIPAERETSPWSGEWKGGDEISEDVEARVARGRQPMMTLRRRGSASGERDGVRSARVATGGGGRLGPRPPPAAIKWGPQPRSALQGTSIDSRGRCAPPGSDECTRQQHTRRRDCGTSKPGATTTTTWLHKRRRVPPR